MVLADPAGARTDLYVTPHGSRGVVNGREGGKQEEDVVRRKATPGRA
jgi:hypothetical protein